jgi:hypothetical protein
MYSGIIRVQLSSIDNVCIELNRYKMSEFDKFFPLRKLGLVKNPFGALTTEEWVAVTVPPPIILEVLKTGFEHLQIIGDRGRGKSTTLHWLCHYFQIQEQSVAYERLPRWHFNYQSDLSSLDCFALDEAQRLFILKQRRLFHEAQGKRLLIGTHISWERAFRRYGWQVTTVYIAHQTTREHIQHILDKRLIVFSTDTGVQVYFDDSAVDYLWDKWEDNLRGMEYFLYHALQKRREFGAITSAYLESVGVDYVEPSGLV